MTAVNKVVSRFFMVIIKVYQRLISPILPVSCRFTPTCSTYSYQSIKKYGIFKGGWLAIKRIVKCHPWGSYGYDPLP